MKTPTTAPTQPRKLGWLGWAALAVHVWVWDRYAGDTLTNAFGRAMHGKYQRPVVLAVWGVITAHLLGALPPKYDPFYLLFHRRVEEVK